LLLLLNIFNSGEEGFKPITTCLHFLSHKQNFFWAQKDLNP
jgi:hypothetical protein